MQATGSPFTREQATERAQSLDVQAARPAGGRAGPEGEKRDYAASAGIAKYTRSEYEGLDASSQLAARSEIDRELARFKGVNVAARHVAARYEGSSPTGEEGEVAKDVDRTLDQLVRAEERNPSAPRVKGSTSGSSQHNSRTERRSASGGESGPVRDFREAAARRKRQLGRDRR
jgi:hypothetical protein